MEAIDRLREGLPPFARDIQLNLSSVLQGGALDDTQRWAVAVACAITTGNPALRGAAVLDAAAGSLTRVIPAGLEPVGQTRRPPS
jgi:hypothetical protein